VDSITLSEFKNFSKFDGPTLDVITCLHDWMREVMCIVVLVLIGQFGLTCGFIVLNIEVICLLSELFLQLKWSLFCGTSGSSFVLLLRVFA